MTPTTPPPVPPARSAATSPAIERPFGFSASTKAIQSRKGSRDAYARMDARGWRMRISDDLRAFVEAQTSVFLGTAGTDGQPYIQHRGGPPGFLHVVDDHTIAFADFSGNRQFITQGNLLDNDRAFLFLIDYAEQRRFKIWGTARVIEDDPDRLRALMPAGYRARGEQVVAFTVTAWDENCSQHIPQRIDATAVRAALAVRDARIAELEAQLAAC